MGKPKILIIEDSSTTQESLKEIFSGMGCDVILASSGEGAMARFKKGLEVDLIILDFKLPGMNGPQFLREMSIGVMWKNIPVVPFTSHVNDSWSPKFMAEWFMYSKTRKSFTGQDSEGVISKGRQGEDVSTIPQHLVLSVADTLRRHGIELPDRFKTMENFLQEHIVDIMSTQAQAPTEDKKNPEKK